MKSKFVMLKTVLHDQTCSLKMIKILQTKQYIPPLLFLSCPEHDCRTRKVVKMQYCFVCFCCSSPYQLLCPSLPGDPQCLSASSLLSLYTLASSLCHSQILMSSRHWKRLTLASFKYGVFVTLTNNPGDEQYLINARWNIYLYVFL